MPGRTFKLFALMAALALAANASEAAAHGNGDPNLHYKLVNFAILAVGVGFLIVKALFPAFRKQQAQILESMSVAERRAAEAAEEAAATNRRMAGLEGEIASLREKAHQEMEAEAVRISRETQVALEKLQRSAEMEIASIAKAARQELKVYSAGLALDLAKQKIKARMDGPAQDALVARFVAALRPGGGDRN